MCNAGVYPWTCPSQCLGTSCFLARFAHKKTMSLDKLSNMAYHTRIMAMLDYNEVTPHKFILRDGEPYEVLTHWVFRKQQRKPVNQTKLKNLISGKVVEITFHQNEKVQEADMGARKIKYLYTNRGESWFCDPENPGDRFQLDADVVGDALRFVKTNSIIEGDIVRVNTDTGEYAERVEKA